MANVITKRTQLVLTRPQYEVIQALEQGYKTVIFNGGVGSGKSFLNGLFVAMRSQLPGSLGLLTAPVFDTLNNATLPRAIDAWGRMGFEEGRDYTFQRPPKSWGIEPYGKLRSYKTMTWRSGAYAILDGSDNFNKHRGNEFDWIVGDEFREFKAGAIGVYTGRLRGGARKRAGLPSQQLYSTTPPDDPWMIQQFEGKKDVKIIHSSTYDNLDNLPSDYITTQAAMLDKRTFEREVLGLLLTIGGLRAAYAFTEANIRAMAFDPYRDLYLTWDFNASQTRPMTTLCVQPFGKHWFVTHEFVNMGTNTPTQCQIITDWLEEQGFRGNLYVTGDATGNDKARSSAATKSDYRTIEEALRSSGKWTYHPHRTRRTRRVKDRVASLNAMFQNYAGERRMFVDPSCAKTKEAMTRMHYAENGVELEENEFREPFDALSYFTYTHFPVHIKKPVVTTY